jgi:type II secretory pathway pseudopilin PulG
LATITKKTEQWIKQRPFLVVALTCIFVSLIPSVILYSSSQNQIHDLETERNERIIGFARVVAENCNENNQQDAILAALLAVSLASSPPKEQLNRQEREGLAVFESALRELRETSPCKQLVKEALRAENSLTDAEIKQILHEAGLVTQPVEEPKPSGGSPAASSSPSESAPEGTQSDPAGSASDSTTEQPAAPSETPSDPSEAPPEQPPSPPEPTEPSQPPSEPPKPSEPPAPSPVDEILAPICQVVPVPLVCQK